MIFVGPSRRHPCVAALLAGVVALGACSAAPDGALPSPPAAASGSAGSVPAGEVTSPGTPPGEPLAWRACGPVECATIAVPLDHRDPGGRSLDLAVARRPARRGDERLGALVFNPGGPGASGVDFVRGSSTFDDLNERFDIVSWDPRGIGRSAPVRCDEGAAPYQSLDWSPDDAEEQEQLDAGARAVADECAAADAELLAHVATDDTARDLDLLRSSLGEDQLTYVGFSYGTLIGLRYAELFPGRVRAMALDGVVDPTMDLAAALEQQTRALDENASAVFATCDAASSCPMEDAAATYDRLAELVEEQPIPAGTRTLGPTALAYAVIGSSYSAGGATSLLAGLADAEAGDGRALLRLADGYFRSAAYGSYLATVCVDSPRPTGGEAFTALERRLEEVSPRFGAAVANEVRPCAFWAAAPTGDPGPVRAVGAAPILVVGNRGDFATPHRSAERVAAELDRGVLLTYDGRGHLSYGKSGCVDARVNDYLTDLDLPGDGTICT